MDETEMIFLKLRQEGLISNRTKLQIGKGYHAFIRTIYYNPNEIKGSECIQFGLLHEEGHLRSHESLLLFLSFFFSLLIVILLFHIHLHPTIINILAMILLLPSFIYPIHYFYEYRCDLYAAKSMIRLGFVNMAIFDIIQKTFDQYRNSCTIWDYLFAHPPDKKRIAYIKKKLSSY